MAWEIGAIENSSTVPVPPADGRPPAPTLQAPAASQVPVTIKWNSIAVATGYNIYRGDSPAQLTAPIANVGPAVTSYVDSSVQAGHTYYYAVTSFDPNKESVLSNVAAVSVPIPPTPTPIAQVNVQTRLPVVIHRHTKPTGKIEITADKGVTVTVEVK